MGNQHNVLNTIPQKMQFHTHSVGRSKSGCIAMRSETRGSLVRPLNGDPFIGMLETPVTSSGIVTTYLTRLPAYRRSVSPLLRGTEIGLAHGFLLPGPFIKLGPLRELPNSSAITGSLSAAGIVVVLSLCLSLYGAASFQRPEAIGVKTLSGRLKRMNFKLQMDGQTLQLGGL